MRVLLVIGLLSVLSACSAKVSTSGPTSSQKIVPDEPPPAVSKVELIDQLKQKGNFLGVQTSEIDSSYQVVTTTEDEKYFLTGDKLVSSSRRPKEDELSLMYWRNFFKGKIYRETELKHENQGHGQPHIRLTCDSLGQGVLYDPAHERVTRVFYYGKK